jgi:hypothetical protein
MSFSVSIHAPKTPVTAGSRGIAKATLPNVCKMPGPPAPFVPSPLPNIAKSGNSPKDYSTSVLIEGEKIAIRGATFESMGDVASQGTGGGLISANVQGPAKFIPPGTMDVKIEGKGVHLKGDQMLNNCASGGTPPNTGATMAGESQETGDEATPINPDCGDKKKNHGWDDCMCGQVCEMVKAYNNSKAEKVKLDISPSDDESPLHEDYLEGIKRFEDKFASLVARHSPNLDHPSIKKMFYSPGPPVKPPDCQHAKWKASKQANPIRSGPGAMNPDHGHPAALGGPLTISNLKWADARVNVAAGGSMGRQDPAPETMKAHPSCNCD